MRQVITFFLCCGLAAGMPSLAESTRVMYSPHPIRVFEAGQAGCNTYRIPALILSSKGTLLAFSEARKHSGSDAGDIDLVLRRSFDQGITWAPLQTIVDDADYTCGNPCPIVDRRSGIIHLLITKNKGADTEHEILLGNASPRTVWITKSSDDGATWTTPVEISQQVRKADWRWYATGPGHGIQLANGRLIAPCDHATGPKPEDMHSHIIFSDDGGGTWHIGGILDPKTNECTVAERADGSLYLNMRTFRETHRRVYATSLDKGITWSTVEEDAALIEPVCQASTLVLPTLQSTNKNRILFANPASATDERINLTLRLSRDGGKTWAVSKTLWKGPAAYSDLVNTADQQIGCLFESGEKNPYENIQFAKFPLEWLTDNEAL